MARADSKSAKSWELDDLEEDETNKIRLHNVEDLTVEGLRRLCGVYGTVVDVVKVYKRGMAIVQFSQEAEAAQAVKRLNMKLGFNYNAVHIMPKETLPVIKTVAPTDVDPAQPLTDESWELTSVKRRFNLGLSLPLVIDFPERESLATSEHYRAKEGRLARTDPEFFFRIYKVQELFDTPKVLDYDPEELERKTKDLKRDYTNVLNQYDGKVFSYRGLTEVERELFEVKYCVVCNGYGFAHCKSCGTNYCSIEHQRQHSEEHDRICPPQGSSKDTPVEIPDVNNTAAAPQEDADLEGVVTNVLTRDPLPVKLNVFITSILTPDRIYVRPADPASDARYVQTVGEFALAGMNSVPVVSTKQPAVGDINLAMYEPLGVWGRVLVTEVRRNKSKCVFIDHGTVEFISNDALLLLTDPDLLSRKVLVYKACLTDITEEAGDREKAIQYLMEIKDRRLLMKYRLESNNIVDVQLQTSQGECVNYLLNLMIIIPPIMITDESYVMYEDVYQSVPAVGKNKQIMILNRTTVLVESGVTWILQEDLPYLQTLQSMVECYGKKVTEFKHSYLPHIGEMCLVRCLEHWYRGVCYETAGDGKPAIFLCDYGCMTLVELCNVRPLPLELAMKSVRTHDGMVANLDAAKKDGLKLDSMFLNIYLLENELIAVDISQETVTGLSSAGKETQTVLNFHELDNFLKSRNKD